MRDVFMCSVVATVFLLLGVVIGARNRELYNRQTALQCELMEKQIENVKLQNDNGTWRRCYE